MSTRELAEQIWLSAARRFPWRVATNRECPILYVNPWVRNLFGLHTKTKDWTGLSIPAEGVRHITQVLADRQLTPRGKVAISRLVEVLLEITQRGKTGLVVVDDSSERSRHKRTVKHELFHQFQFKHRLYRCSIARPLVGHPTTLKALPRLKRWYDIGNPVTVVSEMAAYIHAGDHRDLGLGRAEAKEWFRSYSRLARI